MRTFSPLSVLGALGVLSAAASGTVAAADTSQWKCETCPFEKAGASATLEVGVGAVSDASAKFGDASGLGKRGAFAIAGGAARWTRDGGFFGNVSAADLGLDARSLAAEVGQEGLFAVRLGYAEIPHRISEGALTPFLGGGGSVLTLPAGFPAADTGAMPLATTLQPVAPGFKRTRYDLGAAVIAGEHWTYRVSLRHDVRDGTQRTSGSFFTSAAQLLAPVDQVTDQIEVSTSYNSRPWQVTLAYHASVFRNGQPALSWANPFSAVVSGSDAGQLALAPDNQFHQIMASAGYEISPTVRASADLALGRMTQDANYLAATSNTSLAVPAVPAQSLRGRANTLNASLRITAAPTERLRLNASYTRDERDNQTPSASYPGVTTDMFLGPPRSNPAYSFTQDKFKVGADHRGPLSLKTSVGAEYDARQRSLQEAGTTREATVWGRIAAQPLANLSVALKGSHAERKVSDYLSVAAITPAQNPLLRKYNMADRKRDSAGLRADLTAAKNLNVGLSVDVSYDDFNHSTIGLIDARSVSVGGDVSAALDDETQVNLYAQLERIRSRQAGSQLFAQPDWTGHNQDAVKLVGVGLKHSALKGKLELGADLAFSRSRSDVSVSTGGLNPPFPTATTALDSLKLRANYRLTDQLSLTGSYWYERYSAQDWHFDGVAPSTVSNLLAFGDPPPRYTVNVVQIALRYRF